MKKISFSLACLLFALTACQFVAPPDTAPTPSSTFNPRPTATPYPTPTDFPRDVLSNELQATLTARSTLTAKPDGEGSAHSVSIEGVSVYPIENNLDDRPLWVAVSQGMRAYHYEQNHFVSIFTRSAFSWEELSRLALSEPDYLSEWAVEEVHVEPDHLWLQVQGGAGAHGGCYHLLNFDGITLQSILTNCTNTSMAGELRDLNQDEIPEVLLNLSENQVFCYACGVRIWKFQVWRWDGSKMVELQLSRLPRPAEKEISDLNDRAVALAQSELWKDAQQTIRRAFAMDPGDETIAWNSALIELHAETRAKWVSADSPYPLLSRVFYGDYLAALDILRPYPPADLFDRQTPLVKGTVAEGWEVALRDWITLYANKALQAEPELAAAYFLRGWATYLVNPQNGQAFADMQHAARLDPQESLYTHSIDYLKGQ